MFWGCLLRFEGLGVEKGNRGLGFNQEAFYPNPIKGSTLRPQLDQGVAVRSSTTISWLTSEPS